MPVSLALESSGTNSNLTALLCAPRPYQVFQSTQFVLLTTCLLLTQLPSSNRDSEVHGDSWLTRAQSAVRTTVHPLELLILDVSLALERGMSRELGCYSLHSQDQ